MRLATFACLFSFGLVAAAQDNELTKKVEEVNYPPLAKQARIQGDIFLRIGSGKNVEPLRGHPMLAYIALDNLKDISKFLNPNTGVIYHFTLLFPESTTTTVKKGDALDRFFLRILKIKTIKVVKETRCAQIPIPPKNWPDLTKNPVEIWIYGSTGCLDTANGYVACADGL